MLSLNCIKIDDIKHKDFDIIVQFCIALNEMQYANKKERINLNVDSTHVYYDLDNQEAFALVQTNKQDDIREYRLKDGLLHDVTNEL